MSIEYIHYGDKKFDRDKFDEVTNIHHNKPIGGLWASRLNSETGWKLWCESEGYHLDKYRNDNCFKFKLKEDAKILNITKKEQLEKLPKQRLPIELRFLKNIIDFEELAKQYDAIEVLISEDYELYWDLYGWDCDSILVMNKDVIEEV